jgi:hypothetical protein
MAAGTIELLAREIASALRPLEQQLDPAHREQFLIELGFFLPGGTGAAAGAFGTASVQAGGLGPVIDRLTAAINGNATELVVQEGVTLLGGLKELFTAISGIGPALDGAVTAAAGLTAAQRTRLRTEAQQLPKRLLDHMMIAHIESKNHGAAQLLGVAGIIDSIGGGFDPADPTVLPVPRRSFRLDRMLSLLTNPVGLMDEAFDFGKPTFDGAKLLRRIGSYLVEREQTIHYLTPPGAPERLDALTFDLGTRPDTTPPTVTGRVSVPASDDITRTYALGETWTLTLAAKSRFGAGLEAGISPPLSIALRPAGALHLDASAELVAERVDGKPMLLIGKANGSRLEVTRFAIALGLAADSAGGPVTVEPTARIELDGGHLLIDLSGGDGFLSTLIAGAKIDSTFEIRAEWSPSEGLRFEGSGGLELALPVHLELGPIEITMLYINAPVGADGSIPLEISGGFTAALGPITAAVDRVGVVATTKLRDGGNLGPVDLAFGFKPPKGVGLKVDAGIVAGGGFLYFDRDRGEYAGALELEFAGFIEVKAIGLITTRMPDGKPGFSLLIILTAEFSGGGIQLGFGFTLLGVGGILGLNRRMDLAALAEGVSSGAIESVMFPQDVIANAPRIISDLRKFFPPEDGRFLVGPMAKIGWGTPTLVSVSLGVIVEIPPGNIAILGVLKCILPSQDVPLLVLQVNFIGAFEVDKSRLWFFAQLVDSRILTITIDGGMGLLVYTGDNPDFVLSVGGFHPSFKPPPLPFPVPPRVSIDILNAPGRLIRVSGYFAVTSNTAQFGAKAELRLGFGDFGLEGHLAFDALFRFSPFAFVIEISAGVSLKAFGVGLFSIDLRFQLEGPSPWRAHGRGSISLLFFEISADFDISWGEERTTTLPPVAVLELLEREVRKPEGWQTRLPTGGINPLVTLRQLPAGDELVLHPLGTLFIHQRAIPLDVRIDRVGAQRPSDGKRFSVAPVQGSGLERVSVTDDQFAMAQFQDMDDAAKLSRPAYEKQDAGLELSAEKGAIDSPRVVRRSARYELHIIDNKPPKTPARMAANGQNGQATRRAPKLYSPHPAVFGQLLEGSSTARSPLSQREARLRQPFAPDETVQVTGDRFVIAYRRNNRQAFPPATASSTTSSFTSEATAADAMADWIRADSSLAGQLHILRQAEVGGGLTEPGTWSETTPPPSVVSGADAVRLTGGKVLIAGGADAAGKAVAATGLYDPVATTWADAIPSLKTARQRHTTTKLADGRVVAAGGLGADGAPLASAEVFAPIAGTWTTPEGGLHTARSGHSATVIGGRLLAAGGTGARGAALASAELLDPETLTWTEIAPMGGPRTGHQAVLIKVDEKIKVLVIGGGLPTGEGERALASCEIYDPTTKDWTPTGSLRTPRKGHQATVLADGRVLVTGGDAVPAVPYRVDSLTAAELYDPRTGVWTPAADLPGGGRSGHRSVWTPAGVVVVGGTGRPRATAGYRNVVVFDPGSGAWTITGSLGTGRWDLPAVDLADGRVLAVGGLALAGAAAPGPDPAELAATAEIYLP